MGENFIKYEEYQVHFNDKEKRKEALKQALDIRKFEIDMYWKRATYFWAFIAAAFAAYFVVLGKKESEILNQDFMLFLISSLGLMFSISWYRLNVGSKFWQENWEHHVDFLENDIMGPLYKIVIERNKEITTKRASVSKINLNLSLFITGIWIIMLSVTLCNIFIPQSFFVKKWSYLVDNERGLVALIMLFLIFFIRRLFIYGKTRTAEYEAFIRFRKTPTDTSDTFNVNNDPKYNLRLSNARKRNYNKKYKGRTIRSNSQKH